MTDSNSNFHVKPFGDSTNPHGYYQLLKQHLDWLALHNFSTTTIEKRALYVRAFALWCLQRDLLSPAIITKPMLEAFQRHLFSYRKPDGQPLAWSSQHLHLKELRQFFAWLAKHNFLPFSPAAELELPKLPKQLPKAVLSIDEVELILAQPDTNTPLGLRDRAIFEVLYSSGIRRAELCHLRLRHTPSRIVPSAPRSDPRRSPSPIRLVGQRPEGSLCARGPASSHLDRSLPSARSQPVMHRPQRADAILNH